MASKMDPARPDRLFTTVGSPHQSFPSIHIAGTKGKGSVAAMCAYCLRAAGLKVGLYTSPHLVDFRERIRILTPDDEDGRIPEDQFITYLEQVKAVIAQFPGITWFEIVTALAFMHFAAEKVDIAVVEVGLGGRLDATNALTPLVSVITSLSLDHIQLLGNTLSQIAFEKGGIIKPGIPVISAPQQDEAHQCLLQIAKERGAPLTLVGKDWQYHPRQQQNKSEKPTIQFTNIPSSSFILHPSSFPINLIGDHQVENAAVAVATLNAVRQQFPMVTETAVRQGLAAVQWPGRLQIIHQGNQNTPSILVDCAHNPDSAAKLRKALIYEFTYNKLWLIIGAPEDKDVSGIMEQLFPLADGIIVTTANHPRSVPPETLVKLSATLNREATPAPTMEEAVRLAWLHTQPGDMICVTGSIIVVGDLLNQWDRLQSVLTSVPAAVSNDN